METRNCLTCIRGHPRRRMSLGRRYLHPELRRQSLRVLGLHARGQGQVDVGNDSEPRRIGLDAPLLEFRNKYLDFRPADGSKEEQTDRERRDFRRINGSLTLHKERLVHGPIHRRLGTSSCSSYSRHSGSKCELGSENNAEHAANLELISLKEIEEIRRIWVEEKHEIEDFVPIFTRKLREKLYPCKSLRENLLFSKEDLNLLRDACEGDRVHYEMTRDLLDLERLYRTKARRSGLSDDIEPSSEVSSKTNRMLANGSYGKAAKGKDQTDDEEEVA